VGGHRRDSWPPWHREYDAVYAAAGFPPSVVERATNLHHLLALIAAGTGATRLTFSTQPAPKRGQLRRPRRRQHPGRTPASRPSTERRRPLQRRGPRRRGRVQPPTRSSVGVPSNLALRPHPPAGGSPTGALFTLSRHFAAKRRRVRRETGSVMCAAHGASDETRLPSPRHGAGVRTVAPTAPQTRNRPLPLTTGARSTREALPGMSGLDPLSSSPTRSRARAASPVRAEAGVVVDRVRGERLGAASGRTARFSPTRCRNGPFPFVVRVKRRTMPLGPRGRTARKGGRT
jgi:hypothetical protein